MARYDRLIAFLEHEASVVRRRIETLHQENTPAGVTTGAPENPVESRQLREAEARLREIEEHIHDLKTAPEQV